MVFGTKYASFDNISDDSLDFLHSWVQRAFLLPTDYHFQGWISDMGIDGLTFVPKSGYFVLIWVKVCPQKLAFS